MAHISGRQRYGLCVTDALPSFASSNLSGHMDATKWRMTISLVQEASMCSRSSLLSGSPKGSL